MIFVDWVRNYGSHKPPVFWTRRTSSGRTLRIWRMLILTGEKGREARATRREDAE